MRKARCAKKQKPSAPLTGRIYSTCWIRTSENSVKAKVAESPFHALRWDRDGVRVCTSGEDEQDEHDVDYDVHQPAVGVHPVAHLGHRLLGAPAKQQVREHRKRRYEDGRR